MEGLPWKQASTQTVILLSCQSQVSQSSQCSPPVSQRWHPGGGKGRGGKGRGGEEGEGRGGEEGEGRGGESIQKNISE